MSDASGRSRGTIDVLLVEDNPGDVRLIEEAFRDAGADSELHAVTNGEEALDFVYRRDDHANAPRPDLIILDWNLPRTSGEQVLMELKDDPEHKRIPVTVLTGSQDESDVLHSYRKHANACLKKAVEPDEFLETIRAYAEFWFTTVRLPNGDE
ncbi:response regulator [Haloterrigena salifodinae]|uniref:Response regulator n=1 Tax=Haloterrigena salifodinae TaxID=2675099 RepID=A0A8T8DYM2_9EURY|nr:response regulator [Haloterrigena salifodinae]QRV14674.1 response regulator [Haloterrigena salifodinae]